MDDLKGFVFVSQIAERVGCRPQDIRTLFDRDILDRKTCPVLAGRRLVPVDYVPVVIRKLEEKGHAQT